MAELQISTSARGRRKLATPRIDLTPMVDLGFLLITFFMYATTLARPMVMELQMPYNPGKDVQPAAIPGAATLVILPAAGHRIAYYKGDYNPAESLYWCGFDGSNNLRRLLEEEKLRVEKLPANFSQEAHKLHVLLKPDAAAAYEDMVHALDELAIADVPYYTTVRISLEEAAAIQKTGAPGYGK